MSEHYIIKCTACGRVVEQCRCPEWGTRKVVSEIVCVRCAKKAGEDEARQGVLASQPSAATQSSPASSWQRRAAEQIAEHLDANLQTWTDAMCSIERIIRECYEEQVVHNLKSIPTHQDQSIPRQSRRMALEHARLLDEHMELLREVNEARAHANRMERELAEAVALLRRVEGRLVICDLQRDVTAFLAKHGGER